MAGKAPGVIDEAVILCGGQGTRLLQIVADRPKALIEVRGRPFLEWLLLGLRRHQGIRRAILATGHLGEMIERHFGEEFCGVKLMFSREAEPLGTGGALRLAATVVNSQQLLVLNGDTYCRFDSQQLLDVQTRNAAAATLWLSSVPDAHRFGSVWIDTGGRIVGFEEKAVRHGRRVASAGVYLIDHQVVDGIQTGYRGSLEHDLFPSLVGQGLYGVEGPGEFVDIGTPESLATSRDTLANEFEQLECE